MGRGFGRGAKSVAIVTHAQVKHAKKTPRGFRATSRRNRRSQYRAQAANDDPSSLADTGANRGRKGGKNRAALTLDQQIAGISFQDNVPKGRNKLASLRKDIMQQVKVLKRKHHRQQQNRAQQEVMRVERQVKQQARQAAEAHAAAAAAAAAAASAGKKQAKKQQSGASAGASSAVKKVAKK
jgi:hypothetical protein